MCFLLVLGSSFSLSCVPVPEVQIYPEILEEIDKIRSNAVFNERTITLISYKGKPLNPKHAVFDEVTYIKNSAE